MRAALGNLRPLAVDAVIFDMDGLLVDSEPLWREAEIEIFGGVGVPLTEEMCAQTVGLRIDGIVGHWFDRHPWSGLTPEQVATRLRNAVADLARTRAVPKVGALDLIERLRRRSTVLAVCSSSPLIVIEATLKRLALDGTFDLIHSAESEIFGKPHPAAYLATAARLQAEPSACLALEDSLAGATSAKAAGMKVVAVPEGEGRRDPRFDICDAVLDSLEDLSDPLLARLCGEAP